MDDHGNEFGLLRPTQSRPLLGLTVLMVEDSRYACDALRLICVRSGARIRRADCLRSARRHLEVYRPSVAIIDLGLPDGSGADLIEEMAAAEPRIAVLLAMSGDLSAKAVARAAGADAFLPKPIASVAAFQACVLRHLPLDWCPPGPRIADAAPVVPDRLAYRDDIARAAELLTGGSGRSMDYVARFLSGVALSAGDEALADAAGALLDARCDGADTEAQRVRLLRCLEAQLKEREPMY